MHLVLDKEDFLKVTVESIFEYSKKLGYSKMINLHAQYSELWENGNNPQLLIPVTNQIGDYDSAVRRLIEKFSQITKKDEVSIFYELTNTKSELELLREIIELCSGTCGQFNCNCPGSSGEIKKRVEQYRKDYFGIEPKKLGKR